MDRETELARAQVDRFKRDRLPYVVGHVLATVSLIGIAWACADHGSLLWFGVVHHFATWILALSFYLPFRNKRVSRIPLWTYFGLVAANATLSLALLFTPNGAAPELNYILTVVAVLFAGAAGSFVTLGVHANLIRVSLTSLLLPFVVTAFCFGHAAVALGTMCFYCNVVVTGVWKLANGQQELIASGINAAHRAEIAEKDAETDPLTGLINRRGISRLDGMELSSGATALYIDLNKFKTINDTYGHDIGDEILKFVAQRLRTAVSGNDVVARLGGDEFLVLTFENDADVTDTIITRLSERLQGPVCVSDGNMLEISAAIGRCSTSAPVLKLSDLLRDSDHAMYQSKKNQGRSTFPAMPGFPSLPSANTMLDANS